MNNKQPIRVLEVFGRMNRGGAESMIMNLYRKMDKSRFHGTYGETLPVR